MSSKSLGGFATLLLGCAATVLFSPSLSGSVVFYSFNSAYTPDSATWTVSDLGWSFTVPQTFNLVGLDTLFSSADARTVTLEIYSGLPNDIGSVLLVQQGFTPAGGSLSGATFTPITLIAGQTYFVGFKNVNGLGVNYTAAVDSGVVDLPLYFDVSPPPYYVTPQTGFATGRPILLLYADVPEPAETGLLGLGLLLLLVGRAASTRVPGFRKSGLPRRSRS